MRLGRLRVVELFCGIGGCAAALENRADIVAAVDINREALRVYAHNFPHPTFAREITSLSSRQLRAWQSDLWWMSPPCQPYTRRGRQRDLLDPRSSALSALTDYIRHLRPRYVALENVPEFQASCGHEQLRKACEGYVVQERVLCPTDVGIPNRRRRFYFVAGREELRPWPALPDLRAMPIQCETAALAQDDLTVPERVVREYQRALHVVEKPSLREVTACFTSAYGRSWVRSGSYLRNGAELRRFSPPEILHLLGFPASYRLPQDLPPCRSWPLVGNSLSVPVVRYVLSTIPELAGT